MYRSAALVALVPPRGGDGHVDGAGLPAGAVAVIVVSLFTVKVVAGVLPKFTRRAPVNPGAGDGHRGPTRASAPRSGSRR